MILILSKDFEESTNNVIDWLHYYEVNFYRINSSQFDINKNFFVNFDALDQCTGFPFDPTEVKAVWYRRWNNHSTFNENYNKPENFDKLLNLYLKQESKSLSNGFFSLFSGASWLSKPKSLRIDEKFYYLNLARSYEINTPKTFILNNKADLRKLLESGIQLITKSLSNPTFMKVNNQKYTQYTEEVTLEDLDKITESFYPSLFQEKIVKEYEIRAFYLENRFYSMAIFSQSDEQTEVDFRRYNRKKPNRTVPYKIPEYFDKKLKNMLASEEIDTASVDIIKGNDGKYYFLEVNLVGQFGMVSLPCNYFLEEKIAKHLIKLATKENE